VKLQRSKSTTGKLLRTWMVVGDNDEWDEDEGDEEVK